MSWKYFELLRFRSISSCRFPRTRIFDLSEAMPDIPLERSDQSFIGGFRGLTESPNTRRRQNIRLPKREPNRSTPCKYQIPNLELTALCFKQ